MTTRNWEDCFRRWGQGPGTTEGDKCANAETAIRKAINACRAFDHLTIRVFPQGSYRNHTNVRAESDVDIAVCLMETSFFDDYSFAQGLTRETLGITEATYHYPDFKNDVENALVSYFSRSHVHRGKKAFDIHENTYRVDADAIACFEHRRYQVGLDGRPYYTPGTQFTSDDGATIINWPQQNYDNGVAKNEATGRRFKAVVRALKNLRNEMADNRSPAAQPITSYLIECLVWNVPDKLFAHDGYTEDIREALLFLFGATTEPTPCAEWGEINELKYLFRPRQPWTREQVNAFIVAAWQYIGFS